MLTRMRLKNFKIWRDTGEIVFKPVTMLLGTNSSGKSSLIQSLLLLKQTGQSPDRKIHLNFGGDERNDFFHFGDFGSVLKAGAQSPRQFELDFTFQEGRFQCTYKQLSSRAVEVQELTLSTETRSFRAVRQVRGAYALMVDTEKTPRASGREYAPERSLALPAVAVAALDLDGPVVEDLSLAIRHELENILYLGPLRRKPERSYVWNRATPSEIGRDGHQTVAVLLSSAMLRGAGNNQVIGEVSRWLSRMNLADGLEMRGHSTSYEVVVRRQGVEANLRDVGIGISQVLPVLTIACFAPKNSIVILEEPEIHLHPLAQSVLAELFVETSRERGLQFLVETHSEHLFRRMQTLMAQGKTNRNDCAMYFVERQDADASLRQLDVDEFGTVKNWPDHFFGDTVGETRAQTLARIARLKEQTHG